ncbi:MAG: nucleoside monophosphate kinase [Candidatus Niyogibacteria bacterium]|nr:nucleoside monophosphate kinase [Candidatus Niyogibacteria bacterium]
MDKPINVIFIGRSGCGKGTQADLLKKYLEKQTGEGSVFYIYTGDGLRALTKRQDLLTARLVDEKVMKAGAKAPDFVAVWVWAGKFVEGMDEKKYVILDGSPRTVIEAKLLDEAFNFYGRNAIFPIWLDVSAEEVAFRMKNRGRADDTDGQIKNRLAYYEEYVVPAVNYYGQESKNKLIHIDGNVRDPQLIHKNILIALDLEKA